MKLPEGVRSIASTRATLVMPLTTRPPPLMSGSDAMDRLFLLSECCRDMLGEAIWFMAGANREEALKGVDAFVTDLRHDIRRRTDGKIDGRVS